jgi:hypothetical protein
MSGFKGTDNKAVVRREYDLPIIERWASTLGTRLAYFGLPGPYIEDLLDWQTCIEHSTGVERLRKGTKHYLEDLENHRQLMMSVFTNGLSDSFTLLRGPIEDVILEGHDIDGTCPPRTYGNSHSSLRFCYTLVNLDFVGGVGYRSNQGAIRVQAIEKLFDRQRASDFLLLVTLNVRDKLGMELTKYLEDLKQEQQASEVRETLDWYVHCDAGRKAHKLKAAIPLFMRHQALHHGFDSFCYPPVWYDGNGDNRMVHFAFQFVAKGGVFPTPSAQSLPATLNLVFLTAQSGQLSVTNQQIPGFDAYFSESQLAFLPAASRSRLLDRLATFGAQELQGV